MSGVVTLFANGLYRGSLPSGNFKSHSHSSYVKRLKTLKFSNLYKKLEPDFPELCGDTDFVNTVRAAKRIYLLRRDKELL